MITISLQRTFSIARKEIFHILRDRQTLLITLFFPFIDMFMLGYAIDTNVRDMPTVICDLARTQESRQLVERFANSKDFKLVGQVHTDDEMRQRIVAGKARVGIKIPEHYSRSLQAGETVQIQILVDGSVSSIAAEAVNVGNNLALRESLAQVLGDKPLPVESRSRILFNPDTKSASFFIPALLVILSQMVAMSLAANAIVREKEKGTIEQLFMTPVKPLELILGKMMPYFVLTFFEFCAIALIMWTVFQVPINGAFITLLAITLPFVLTMLAWGLSISTVVSTRDAATQMTLATIMPCVFLSGYVFPLDSLPHVFYYVSHFIPTTWLIDASRGVILRGAGWRELWLHAVVLTGMGVAFIAATAFRFRKQLA